MCSASLGIWSALKYTRPNSTWLHRFLFRSFTLMSHEWDSTRHRLIASASSNGVGNDHRRDDVKLLRSTDLSDLDADHRRGSYSTIVARVDFEKVPSLLLLQLCFRLLPTSVQTGPAAAKLFLPTWDPSLQFVGFVDGQAFRVVVIASALVGIDIRFFTHDIR